MTESWIFLTESWIAFESNLSKPEIWGTSLSSCIPFIAYRWKCNSQRPEAALSTLLSPLCVLFVRATLLTQLPLHLANRYLTTRSMTPSRFVYLKVVGRRALSIILDLASFVNQRLPLVLSHPCSPLFLQENLESPSVIHETLPPQPLPNDCATQRSRKMALERNRVATPFGITASLRKMWFVQRRIQVNQNAFAIPIKYSMPFSIHLDPLNWHFVLLHYRRNIPKYSILWIVLPRNKKTDRLEYPEPPSTHSWERTILFILWWENPDSSHPMAIAQIQWATRGALPRVGSIQVTKSPKRRRMESIDRPLTVKEKTNWIE